METEEDVESPNKKPRWYRTSPLDIGHLDRLLNKKFTPLLRLVLIFLYIILDANLCFSSSVPLHIETSKRKRELPMEEEKRKVMRN